MAKAKRRPASRSSRRRAREPSILEHLAPWADEAAGIGLLVLAILGALGIWFDSAGPFGAALAWAAAGAVGDAAMAAPVLGLYWGAVLLRDAAEGQRVRMAIGFGLALAGILGIVSTAQGNPSPAAGWHGLHEAGGLLGAVLAWPLSRVLSAYGAAVVCAGLAALGLLIFTGTPFSVLVERVREARTAVAERRAELAARRAAEASAPEP
ncbi:MAG TPA: DNA translocase FtsK 4TM domain-containing protein, partial [Actinomycetota bacterium]|nr:DNA translocase FtsK 4TM domain-containing protein [Actinomycetota bacterium]